MRSLDDRDVILVTLDSCRYDTAERARTPNLDRLGPVHRAETAGTYTLPAHTAFFAGAIPTLLGDRHRIGGDLYDAVWRSAAARPSAKTAAVRFTGRTLMDHHRARGHHIIGAGGVTFFDPREPANWLPDLFDDFHYYGRPNRTAAQTRVQDRDETLTLTHAAELADAFLAADRSFLFINCPGTHIPYTTPLSQLDATTETTLERLYALHDGKTFDSPGLNRDEIATLLDLQVRALEWADRQLGILFRAVADREPLVVVCADHGEEFGEGDRYGHGHPHSTVTTVPLWSGVLSGAPQ
ncbi:sulfatase-like hydrolase/transferase [Promicromonospora sp. NPDC059942]|uniref:sulfatase-like hydrolase/transferase n=1 Tax=Promicromonospora sp. NPDC059942 TaxID=3347009 RepID=UPI003652E649